MSTEVLGFLIIAGTVVVLVLRRQLKLTEPEKIETAADRLQQELEQSADEIIARMGEHIDHLETLVAEADRRAALLEQQIERARNLQPVETEEFSRLLDRSMTREASPAQDTVSAPVAAEAAEARASGVRTETTVSTEDVSEEISPSVRVRELLRQGRSNEEIARETRMGRGAIELIRQMYQYHH